MQSEEQVDAERLDGLRLGAERGQAKRRIFRPEDPARVRLESEHAMWRALATGDPPGLGDHCLMAEMDAVEIADGDDGAALCGGHAVMAEDTHGALGAWGCSVSTRG